MLSAFLLLGAAVGYLAAVEPTGKPWESVFQLFWPFWLLLLAAVGAFCLTVVESPVRDVTAVLFSSISGVAATLVSLEWGTIYGPHDGWVALGILNTGNLLSVPYPGLHHAIPVVAPVLGISNQTAVQFLPLLIAAGGPLLAYPAIRIVVSAPQTRQLALVAFFPAFFLRFVPRPFSLAMVFLPLVYWLSVRQRRLAVNGLTVGAAAVVTFIHPLVAIFAAVIFGVARYTNDDKPSPLILFLIGVFIIGQLFVWGGFGLYATRSTVVALLFETSAGEQSAVGGGSLIVEALTTFQGFREFLARTSFVIAIGIAATVGAITYARRSGPSLTAVSYISSLLIGGFFIVVAFVVPVGVGIYRALLVAPIVLLPAAVRALSLTRRQATTVSLALLIVTSGLGVAYLTPEFTGGRVYSATPQQAASVEWTQQHRGESTVLGGYVTAWMVEGMYGQAASEQWSPTPRRASVEYLSREYGPPWLTERMSPAGLAIVSELDLTREDYCYPEFETGANRVYSNAESSVFQPRSFQCDGRIWGSSN
ncbi:hypothetical protein SG26_20445 (plasmid) [Haloarcula sp. CBA1115]|nr:hypothetical protein SG26_20445 [Haloarcula sp. CBA1115]